MDKKLAGEIKRGLEDYEFEVFLAHEDIEPTTEWADKILTELKNCDVFIPILTENFHKSVWTNQEIGVALAHKRFIIPLKASIDPDGFIKHIQALRFDPKEIESCCRKVFGVINDSDLPSAENYRDSLIEKFGDSWSFVDANYNTSVLLSCKNYNPRQIKTIMKHAIGNNQISGANVAQKNLRNFIKKYENDIDPKLLKAFNKAMGYE
ncbi:MAG: toll/interleukin-1 receptor domain-containing protein [candidate division Zixibacteria bacterium]|nr:toll/interleukin-1 receptor domain-containing protein [candidate division Zixibacteria bacterium]